MSTHTLDTGARPRARAAAGSPLLALVTRLHFYIGLFVGPFILVAAVTGTLFVLTPQIENWLYADQLRTESAGQAQPLARQVEAAQARIGAGPRLFAVRPAPRPGDTTRVMFSQPGLGDSESRALFVDPVTLDVRGDMIVYGTSGSLPFRTTLDYLHRNLMLGELGRNYSELAASWTWIASLGGLALWFVSRQRNGAAAAARSPRLRTRRWHTLLGLWLAVGLLFLSATGLTWSNWAGARVDQLRAQLGWITPSVSMAVAAPGGTAMPMGGEHADHHGMHASSAAPAPTAAVAQDFDRVLESARRGGIDASELEIRPPRAADQGWMVREVDRSWPTQVDTVVIDPASHAITSRADFATFPLIAKLIRWGVDMHMGILFGWPNQLLMAAIGTALSAMVVLGYRMWWLRRPVAGTGALTLTQAWLGLSGGLRAVVATVAVVLGWCLPVMGVSLLAFLAVDVVRSLWRGERAQARPA
ncbi:PepSY-associated TM helix domain-containing protein [Bordetella genomosp. 13]|uniref:PepSY-associated TM helix domain-containing protein n=1 Tax=Bordetella genomosp. 13 TaxID=463040 RepID=UPI0011AAD169|nr:PepSY-associated TM helix domain-containing protein [Bordetella genomosp. 13]